MQMHLAHMHIVPTPVGVNRRARHRFPRERYCPHARGGEPPLLVDTLALALLSPRPWG